MGRGSDGGEVEGNGEYDDKVKSKREKRGKNSEYKR